MISTARTSPKHIREPEISLYASAVSAIPAVRRLLVAQQQRLGAETGGVLEGRDIGTKVFPDTPYKFFLTAVRSSGRSGGPASWPNGGPPRPYDGSPRGDDSSGTGTTAPGPIRP